jgi:hypothetical protein
MRMRLLNPVTLIVVVIAAIMMGTAACMPSADEVSKIKEQTNRIEERLVILRIKAAPFLIPFKRPTDEEYEQWQAEAKQNLKEHLANVGQ